MAKILVGNLPTKTSIEELTELFSPLIDSVIKVSLTFDLKGASAGHAFIELSGDDAMNAIEQLNGTEMHGRILNFSLAEQPQDNKKEKAKKRFIFF